MTSTGRYGARALLHDLRTRFRLGWDALPPADRKRWLRLIGGGAVALVLLMLAMVQGGKWLAASGALAWEADFLRGLETGGPFSYSTGVWFQTLGTDITLWILISLTAGIALWTGRPLTALSILLAYAVLDPVVRLGWLSWDRARPTVLYEGVTAPSFHAFPSGHTAKTVAVYGLLAWIWIRSAPGWLERTIALLLLALITFVVPFGRMTMGVHWPSDVIAGWLLGATWCVLLVVGLRHERPVRREAVAFATRERRPRQEGRIDSTSAR